jgi:hypothetical protein
MKHSTRPQTIATVTREVDIKSFRDNPEWYEITPDVPEPVKKTVKQVKKTKEIV